MRELEARRVEGRGVRPGSTSVNVRKEARKRKRKRRKEKGRREEKRAGGRNGKKGTRGNLRLSLSS